MNVVINKAVVIGVAIFITVAITSAIFVSIGLMRDVYSDVYETDVTISSGFSEFDQYDNTEKTGLDLLNTLNKYCESKKVKVNVGGATYVNQNETTIQAYDPEVRPTSSNKYNTKYKCTVSINKTTNVATITFTKK